MSVAMPHVSGVVALCETELASYDSLEKQEKQVKLVLRVVSRLARVLREHHQVLWGKPL